MDEAIYIPSSVNESNVVIRRGSGGDEIIRICLMRRQQAIVDHPIFLGGKDVRTDGKKIVFRVDEAKRQAHELVPDHYFICGIATCARYLFFFFPFGPSFICPVTLASTF
jgi:hypothetical protein